MAHVENHLSVEDLAARYRSCEDVCSARHFQTIWLLAQGHMCVVPTLTFDLLFAFLVLGHGRRQLL